MSELLALNIPLAIIRLKLAQNRLNLTNALIFANEAALRTNAVPTFSAGELSQTQAVLHRNYCFICFRLTNRCFLVLQMGKQLDRAFEQFVFAFLRVIYVVVK